MHIAHTRSPERCEGGSEQGREKPGFPLQELPVIVLANLFAVLPVAEGARLSLVSKKFLQAFRDNTVWERRCRKDISPLVANPEQLRWIDFYKHNVRWKVRIVKVFEHQGRRCLSLDFTLEVSPSMTVGDFLEMLRQDKRSDDCEFFAPLCSAVEGHQVDGKFPNCFWDDRDLMFSIAKAGLCNGAVLEGLEEMMED
jgi:hypothetical protein